MEGGCVIYRGQSEAVIYARYLPGSVRSPAEAALSMSCNYRRGICVVFVCPIMRKGLLMRGQSGELGLLMRGQSVALVLRKYVPSVTDEGLSGAVQVADKSRGRVCP